MATGRHPVRGVVVPGAAHDRLGVSLVRVIAGRKEASVSLLVCVHTHGGCLRASFFAVATVVFGTLAAVVAGTVVMAGCGQLCLMAFLRGNDRGVPNDGPKCLQDGVRRGTVVCSNFDRWYGLFILHDRWLQVVVNLRRLAKVGEGDGRDQAWPANDDCLLRLFGRRAIAYVCSVRGSGNDRA